MRIKPLLGATLAGMAMFSSAAGGQQAASVLVDRATCARAVAHVADPGVAYVAGTDVTGRPVVSADLEPRLEPRERFRFVVSVTPLHQPALADTTMPIADVEIDAATGEVAVDGQTLGPAGRAALVAACRSQAGRAQP